MTVNFNVHDTGKTYDPEKIYNHQNTPEKAPRYSNTFGGDFSHIFVGGADIPKPKLDWQAFPCCGGKGTKWVKKSERSHRKTLVKCEECDATKERVEQEDGIS